MQLASPFHLLALTSFVLIAACGSNGSMPTTISDAAGAPGTLGLGGAAAAAAGATATAGATTVGGASGAGAPGTGGAGTAGSGDQTAGATGTAGGSGGMTSVGGSSGSAGAGGAALGISPAKQYCPGGPYPTPKAGASTNLCVGFNYNHGYNEGPTWLGKQGFFVFSNYTQGATNGMITGDIVKYTPGGTCEIFIPDVGTNGLAVSSDGRLIGASHKTRSVSQFDLTTGEPTVLVNMYMGKMLDSPNDLIVHSNGGIYFSNPDYELGGRPAGFGPAAFWLSPTGVMTLLAQGGEPNGVALSPDEKTLYIVEGGAWDLDANGTPSNKRDFPLDADGIAVDCAGNLYMSGGAIEDSTGKQIGTFPGGTNLSFGGPDGKTLFVVGGGTSVHSVQMNVPGLP